MNIKKIIKAYAKSSNPTQEESAEAKRRLEICAACPSRREIAGIDICGKCYCILSKKAFSDEGSCPIGKW